MPIKHIILLSIVISFATSAIVTSLIIGGGVLPLIKPEIERQLPGKFDFFSKPEENGKKSEDGVLKSVSQDDLVIAAVKKASPAVVSVIVTKDLPVMEQYFTNPFGNDFW